MTAENVKRKLSAIFGADVQGYSRLTGDDEHATVETITAYRKIMTDLIQGHHGRVVDSQGDNLLPGLACNYRGKYSCAIRRSLRGYDCRLNVTH